MIVLQIILIILGALGGYGLGKVFRSKPGDKIILFNIVTVRRAQLHHISLVTLFISTAISLAMA